MGSYGSCLDEGWKVGCVKCHFLDSGSYGLKKTAKEYAKESGKGRWSYYETDEFWAYVDLYANFVQKHRVCIDYFANVDVIYNPELSYRNQKYLEEKHGLRPVPVIHYGADLSWLRKYMDEGYDFIGVGGLAEDASQEESRDWIDSVFDVVCDTPNRLPKVRIHLFGVTSHWMLWRWPAWSSDSTAWTKGAAYGRVLFPREVEKNGEKVWDFKQDPFVVFTSTESPHRGGEYHYLEMTPKRQAILKRWLDHIGIPLGDVEGRRDENEKLIEPGVLNHHTERRAANLLLFEEIARAIPEWPWPFPKKPKKAQFTFD